MSSWRRVAIQKIPKERQLIERCESVGMLWVDLWFKFIKAHRDPVDDETIRGVYEFANWTFANCSGEIMTSTCFHFYEDIPLDHMVRQRLPEFMTRAEFAELTDIFKYKLTPDEHREFVREFMSQAHT